MAKKKVSEQEQSFIDRELSTMGLGIPEHSKLKGPKK